MRPLGRNQRAWLSAIADNKGRYWDGCGYTWTGRVATRRLCESLEKLGLLTYSMEDFSTLSGFTKLIRGVWRITEEGWNVIATIRLDAWLPLTPETRPMTTTARLTLRKTGPGTYETRDGRFKMLQELGMGGWFFYDLAWERNPCDKFNTLAECRDAIARTLGRPDEGRPGGTPGRPLIDVLAEEPRP